MSEDAEQEPIPGLPAPLPQGEQILWQGSPQWRGLARHVFYVRWIAAYFAVFITARELVALKDGEGLAAALISGVTFVGLAAVCLGLLTLLAWLNARATIYTITTRRVVMRFGVALPMTFNLPFKKLASADLRARKEGDGDIALELSGPDRLAWLVLWPHARPWRFTRAQPMLLSLPDAARVAGLLGDAVRAFAAAEAAAGKVGSPSAVVSATTATTPAAPERVGLGAALTTQAGR